MVWAPYATTSSQWIANKVLEGFFGAPIESLCEISIADVVCLILVETAEGRFILIWPYFLLCTNIDMTAQWFTHERGTYMGYYALFLCGSNFLAPVIAGFINDGQGWEWVLVSDDRVKSSNLVRP